LAILSACVGVADSTRVIQKELRQLFEKFVKKSVDS
jgi:hypothetical protein